MNYPCGKTFAEGVNDGVSFALVCGENGQLCNDCTREDAVARALAAASEEVRIESSESNASAEDAQAV